jgi:predicted nucleotidyltransferase
MPKSVDVQLCSTREFARLRGISRQRVLALLAEGRIAGARWIGRRWAIPRSASVEPPGRTGPAEGLPQLTPLENRLLAEFAARVRALAGTRLGRIAVFGSRIHGRSRPDSDLDVAVFLAGREDRALRAAIYAAAADAGAALGNEDPALLQPSVIFGDGVRTRFVETVEREGRQWRS